MLVEINVFFTNFLVNLGHQFLILRQLKMQYMDLERSSNGKVWLIINLVVLWIVNNSNLYQMQVNLSIGLLLNIFIIKFAASRRRLNANNLFLNRTFFPSENVAHMAFITYFFLNLWPVHLIYVLLLAWFCSVCTSMLMMRRNYIGNILTGLLFGFLEGVLLQIIYLEQEPCTDLILWIIAQVEHETH